MRAWGLCLALACVGCGPALPATRAAPLLASPQFVVRRGTRLERGGRPLRWVGSSAFHLQEEAAREALGWPGSRGRLDATLALARRSGLSVLRVAAFNDGPRDRVALQPSPGVLGAEGFAGLDRVVAEAGRAGLSLVLVVSNYWDDYGGLAQYLRWRGLDPAVRARAFRTPELARDVADYARALVRHRNALTGLRYADDPTIAAWEVMNEPRGEGLDDAGETLASFVHTVALALREGAPRQLVLVGDEGFDAELARYDGAWWSAHAPGLLGPARHEGYARMLADPAIDGATVHLYPEAWGVPEALRDEVSERWLREHARVAREAGRPLWVEEFGLAAAGSEAWRQRVFALALDEGAVAVMPWGLRDRLAPGDRDGLAWQRSEGGVEALSAQTRGWAEALERATGAAPGR